MKRIVSNKCTFCELYTESILHLFYDCSIIKTLWLKIDQVLKNTGRLTTDLCCKDVILGYKLNENMKSNIFINNVLLHVKFYIWKCKCIDVIPSYDNLRFFIEKRKLLECSLEVFYDQL